MKVNKNATKQLLEYVCSKDSVPRYLAESSHPVRDAMFATFGEEVVENLADDLFAGIQEGETLGSSWFGVALDSVFRAAEQGCLTVESRGYLAMRERFAAYVGARTANLAAKNITIRAVTRVLDERRSYSLFLDQENQLAEMGSKLKGYMSGL